MGGKTKTVKTDKNGREKKLKDAQAKIEQLKKEKETIEKQMESLK